MQKASSSINNLPFWSCNSSSCNQGAQFIKNYQFQKYLIDNIKCFCLSHVNKVTCFLCCHKRRLGGQRVQVGGMSPRPGETNTVSHDGRLGVHLGWTRGSDAGTQAEEMSGMGFHGLFINKFTFGGALGLLLLLLLSSRAYCCCCCSKKRREKQRKL